MPIITVSQLNNYIKRYIDQNVHLSDLWIKGEISNFKKHYSGHFYFTIKDENTSLKAVMFKGFSGQIKFMPSDGMKVVVFGKISVYEASGTYQLYAETMIPDGAGELYAAYEQLKAKLESQGLFSVEHKKIIPSIPNKIGIITSVSGAALKDILNVIKRRYNICDVVIYPAKVQGIGAADSVCDGISYFSKHKNVDLIIIARGGGSIEDLWAFNEEKLAYAIFDCSLPIITGIGHETDYTIADFVADLRAPTPSAAAELAVPSKKDLIAYIENCRNISYNHMKYKLELYSDQIKYHSLDSLQKQLNSLLEMHKYKIENINIKLHSYMDKKLDSIWAELSANISALNALNPISALARGYSIATDTNGHILKISNAVPGDEINLYSQDGTAECVIRRISYDKKTNL